LIDVLQLKLTCLRLVPKLGLDFRVAAGNVAMLGQKYRNTFCLSRFRQPEVGIVDAAEKAIDIPMATKKDGLTAPEKLLIHEFRNCVHRINMELDLAERGLEEKFNCADLVSAVDFMTRSLEELRVRLSDKRGGPYR
jgi:hypothetical protein